MTWIPTTKLILFRRLQWRIAVHLLEGKQRVSPFYRDFLLPKWRAGCKQRVSIFHQTFWLAHSKAFDFRSFSSLEFLMPKMTELREDLQSNSSSALTVLWLSSPASSCVLFDIASRLLMELKTLMLNQHKRWFHSSRVKIPFVSMSSSWFLMSMHLIWILGSRLIRSNSQSRATLWVRETCLIVGFLPLMIILITASLSSNTYNKASWRADWTFEGTESMSFITSIRLWDLWCFLTSLSGCTDKSETRETFRRTETSRSHSSRAGKPSNLSPVSKEMISDSFELWETVVYFLHIQLIGTKVWLPKMHNVHPEVDFESSRSPAKSEPWNSPSLHCLAVLPTWHYCLYSHVWWIYEINRFRRLSHALVHFVMDRASLCTDHKISSLPIRSKYKHCRNFWEHTFYNLLKISILLLWSDGRQSME